MSKLIDLLRTPYEEPWVCVHDGIFHADEVHAAAALKMTGNIKGVMRSRDPQILNFCKIRVDVGGKYDPETLDFDHHQQGGAGARPNGTPFSSLGLIWSQIGTVLCGGSQEVADLVDSSFVVPIDIRDTGYKKAVITKAGMYNTTYTLGDIVTRHNPGPHLAERNFDRAFEEMVEMAMRITIPGAINAVKAEVWSRDYVRDLLAKREDPRILVLDRYFSWNNTVSREGKDVLVVIYPSDDETGWKVTPFNGLKLPAEWKGLTDKAFQAFTGVADAKFCSDTGHLAGAYTPAGALALAKIAVELTRKISVLQEQIKGSD